MRINFNSNTFCDFFKIASLKLKPESLKKVCTIVRHLLETIAVAGVVHLSKGLSIRPSLSIGVLATAIKAVVAKLFQLLRSNSTHPPLVDLTSDKDLLFKKVYYEIRQNGEYVSGSIRERQLLGFLGFDVNSETSPYQNKTLLFSDLTNHVEANLNHFSLDSWQKTLKNSALEIRLKSVGMDSPLLQQKFSVALEFLNTQFMELSAHQKQIAIDDPNYQLLSDLPLARKKAENYLQNHKTRVLEQTIARFWKSPHLLEAFAKEKCSSEEFATLLKQEKEKIDIPHFQRQSAAQACDPLKRYLAFYAKWGKYIRAEMIQSLEDPQALLVSGLCLSLSYKVQVVVQKNPSGPIEDLLPTIKATHKDRFRQALHSCHVQISQQNEIADHLLREDGFEEDKKLMDITDSPQTFNLGQILTDHDFEPSHGCIRLHLELGGKDLSSHAIFNRLDAKLNKVWTFDPNIGLLNFEDSETNNKEAYEDAKKLCLSFLRDLLLHLYSPTYMITIRQLIPK